jgi:uncharacterized protein (TIGR02118 family)
MKCITILYPAEGNEGFDFGFYERRHAPLIKDIMGPSLHRIEVRRGVPDPQNPNPQYVAVISIWVKDWAHYQKAIAERQQELIDEAPLFTKQMPQVQIDEVAFEL